jgi:hypothetical protein
MNFLGFFDQKWIKRSLLHRRHWRAHLKHFEREVGMDKKSGPGKAPCSFLGEFQGAGKGNEVQQLFVRLYNAGRHHGDLGPAREEVIPLTADKCDG